MKSITILITTILTIGIISIASAADMPTKTVIDSGNGTKAAVNFSHGTHPMAGKCATCHVNADGTGGLIPELKNPEASFKNAYHARCIDCHKEKAKGPVKCLDCHK
ncbi:MAG: cytochrome c3 family protein [bacterium]|nr:cytochrome c family protein [bacterium]